MLGAASRPGRPGSAAHVLLDDVLAGLLWGLLGTLTMLIIELPLIRRAGYEIVFDMVLDMETATWAFGKPASGHFWPGRAFHISHGLTGGVVLVLVLPISPVAPLLTLLGFSLFLIGVGLALHPLIVGGSHRHRRGLAAPWAAGGESPALPGGSRGGLGVFG